MPESMEKTSHLRKAAGKMADIMDEIFSNHKVPPPALLLLSYHLWGGMAMGNFVIYTEDMILNALWEF